MDDFPIVDPHHHLYDFDSGNYPWLNADPMLPRVFGDYSAIKKNYLLADFLADARNQKLEKSVHVQMEFDPTRPVEETRWLQRIADEHGFPHGIVAYANLASPGLEATLAAHCQYPNVRGIRQLLNWDRNPDLRFTDRPDYMTDPTWLAGFGLLRKYGLSFDLQIYYTQMDDALQVARKNPDTLVILNHTGMPVDRSAEGRSAWRAAMKRLAKAPNVICKISGLEMTDWHWTTESIRPDVLDTIDAFGADRCMFASNFPVDKLFSSYDAIFDAFKAITSGFSPAERRKLFHDNAERFYRL